MQWRIRELPQTQFFCHLVPASGDLSVDSDVEETPDDLLDEDYVMEPAGEMEKLMLEN